MVRMHGPWRALVAAAILATTAGMTTQPHQTLGAPAARCAAASVSDDSRIAAGHPYLFAAYLALDRDRGRYAGLGPLRHSDTLSAVAERHSAYMATIGSWSDGDPGGGILGRVQNAGLNATYAGQNVVTAHGATVLAAIQSGEQFFGAEAGSGGPHWDNITNPNHRYVGMGVALLGSPGDWTIYLTQVFSDAGGCNAGGDTFAPAADVTPSLRIGATAHPSVDQLQLRSEPNGMVITTLHPSNRLRIVGLQDSWAQVRVMPGSTFGWVFAPFLTVS